MGTWKPPELCCRGGLPWSSVLQQTSDYHHDALQMHKGAVLRREGGHNVGSTSVVQDLGFSRGVNEPFDL